MNVLRFSSKTRWTSTGDRGSLVEYLYVCSLDMMLADCELGSNYGSVCSDRVRYCGRQFSECPYDRLYVKNVRNTRIAERKKPLLITLPKVITDEQTRVESQRDTTVERVFSNSCYEARRKFFQDLERETQNSESASKAGLTSTQKEENISRRDTLSTAFSPTGLYNSHLTKKDTKENVNDCIVLHPVKRESMAQPSFGKLVKLSKIKPCSRNVTSCTINGNDRIAERNRHQAMDRVPTNGISTPPESNKGSNDSSQSLVDTESEQRQQYSSRTRTKIARNAEIIPTRVRCAEMLQRDKNDNNEENSEQSLSNPASNRDERSINHPRCEKCSDIIEANSSEKERAPHKVNDNVARIKLKEQSVRSWIENSAQCENNRTTGMGADTYESYCDEIAKIVESIDRNITSSRTELDTLPDTNTCVKYNLNSTNMSLIYSLTPPADVGHEENDNDDTSWDLATCRDLWDLESLSDSFSYNSYEPLADYIWIEPITANDSANLQRPEERGSSSGSSNLDLEQLEQLERHSANGSDILELPRCTILELKDIDGEVFHNGINESANEIIADLNASDEASLPDDALHVARYIIAEIIESVCILSYLDSSIYDLGVIKEVVRRLIDSYRYEYSLIELADRTRVTDTSTASDNDNICRIKSFLGNLSSDFHYTSRVKQAEEMNLSMQEKEDQSYSAIIEFCTVAKKLPAIVDDKALELNFRILKVLRNEPVDEHLEQLPDTRILCDTFTNLIHNDNGRELTETDETVDQTKDEDKDEDIEECVRCPYCQEEEQQMGKKCPLTPISEEPVMEDETPCKTADPIGSVLEIDESSSYLEVNCRTDAAEEDAVNAAVSLDGTYTISEVSDNDETNDLQDRRIVCDLSVDCMSYSYDTKEFMLLEKTLADSS